MKKDSLVLLAGFLMSLAGFTPDLFNNSASVRLFFVFLGTLPILFLLPKKTIEKKYYFSFMLFTLYLIFFILSCFINNTDNLFIFREFVLYYVVIIIYFLIYNDRYLNKYINGLTIGLILLVLYFMFNIKFGDIWSLSYRLATELNTISIAYMALILFVILSTEYLDAKNKIEKTIILNLIAITILVIVATKVRTVQILMLFVFIMVAKDKISRGWFFIFLIAMGFIFMKNFESIQLLLRLSDQAQIGGADISSLSGRTTIWNHAFQMINTNIFFGVGPEKAVFSFGGGSSLDFHNAYLQILGNTGLIGAIPIFSLLLIGLYNALTMKGMIVYRLLFFIGLIGGITEARMFNFGSPANLLIMISIIKLSFVSRRRTVGTGY